MRVQGVVVPMSGIHLHRIVNPFSYMEQQTNVQFEILCNSIDEHKIDCDVLVYNKWLATSSQQIRTLQGKGMKVVVDVDDYWEVANNHPNYQAISSMGIPQLTLEHIKLADVVTCTTNRLAEQIKPYNKNVVVIPNALPFDTDGYQPGDRVRARELSNNDRTRFMYLAGATHLDDVKLLVRPFDTVYKDDWLKVHTQYILCGYEKTKAPIYKTKEDMEARVNIQGYKEMNGVYDDMADIFRGTGKRRFIIYPSIDLYNYLNYYDSADVAIVPLQDTFWNSMKSELKLIEAAVKRIPVICSNVAPYSDVVKFSSEGVMLINNSLDWVKYFNYCSKNPNFVTDQGEKLYQWCKQEYDLVKVNETRMQLYRSLCNG